MATTTISGEVVDLLQETAAITALCSEIWADEIPETNAGGSAISPPVILVEVPTENTELNFESYHVTGQVKISVYAHTRQATDALAAAFGKTYAITSDEDTYSRIQLLHERNEDGKEEVIDADGNRVFFTVLYYQVIAALN